MAATGNPNGPYSYAGFDLFSDPATHPADSGQFTGTWTAFNASDQGKVNMLGKYFDALNNLNAGTFGNNAWPYPNDYTQSEWLKTGLTIGVNAIAGPVGADQADKLIETATTGGHYVSHARSFINGVSCSFTAYFKADGRNIVRINCAATGMTTQSVDLNLTTGVATTIAGTATKTVETIAGGWYKLVISFTPDHTATGAVNFKLINGSDEYTGDGMSGVYMWGAQDYVVSIVTGLDIHRDARLRYVNHMGSAMTEYRALLED
jgi:hypothetical protein